MPLSYFRTNSYFHSEGVTLIEIIVVVAIAGILLGAGIPLTWDFYMQSELRAERSNAVAYLRAARTRAMSNKGETAHGVAAAGDNFVIFEGPSYAGRNVSRDQLFPRSPGIIATGTTEVVFAQLSGRAASSTMLFASSSGGAAVRVNSEGLIE